MSETFLSSVRCQSYLLHMSLSVSTQHGQYKSNKTPRRGYKCDKTGHLARDCQKPMSESQGKEGARKPIGITKSVTTCERKDPVSYLESDSDTVIILLLTSLG